MAYDGAYLGTLGYAGSKGGLQYWTYDTVDGEATIQAAGYFTDGKTRGMNKGDPILVRFFDTLPLKTTYLGSALMSVGSLGAAGTTTATLVGEDETIALTATVDGLTTGLMSAGSRTVIVTSSNANFFVTLPAPVVGTEILLMNNSGTGYKIRSSAPASISINGGTGASAGSALLATALLARLVCISATAWIGNSHVAVGTESAIAAAA